MPHDSLTPHNLALAAEQAGVATADAAAEPSQHDEAQAEGGRSTSDTAVCSEGIAAVETPEISMRSKDLVAGRFPHIQVSSSGIVALSARQSCAAQVGDVITFVIWKCLVVCYHAELSIIFGNMLRSRLHL